MALPFSSIDYSGSVQNLTFVNDTLNPIIGGAISLNAVTGVVTFRASTVPAKRLFQAYTSGTLTGPNGVTNTLSALRAIGVFRVMSFFQIVLAIALI